MSKLQDIIELVKTDEILQLSRYNRDLAEEAAAELEGYKSGCSTELKEWEELYDDVAEKLNTANYALTAIKQIIAERESGLTHRILDAKRITAEERADRLEAIVDRMSETISECVLLIRPLYDLVGQIEICGASTELTKAVTMAADIMHKLMAATGTKQLPPEV